jgi:hypothetical protein
MRFGTRDRDAGLRRVSSMTRWLAGGAVALVGALSALVAQALPGTSGAAATPPSSPASGSAPTATSPAPSTTTTTTDPGLQPAPAPVQAPTHHHAAQSGSS